MNTLVPDVPPDEGDEPDSSDDLLLARLLKQATAMLGDHRQAEAWMIAPAPGLDNHRPIDLISSTEGAEAIKAYIQKNGIRRPYLSCLTSSI